MSPLLPLLLACAAPKAPPAGPSAEAPATDAAPSSTTPAAIDRRAFAPVRDDAPVRQGICYGPYRDGQRPGGPLPSREQMAEDLAILADDFPVLRTYGSRGTTRTLLELVAEEDLPVSVVVGAWISHDDEAANDAEVAEAIALARDFPEHVVAVAVGNETQVSWSAHRSPVEPLIAHIRDVRAAIDQPVTTADDYKYWVLPESRAVAAEIDFLLVHAHPLWNGQQRADGIAWLSDTLDDVRAMHPGVPLALGEIGWATSHAPDAAEGAHIRGETGVEEQAAFWSEFQAWAAPQDLVWFWFSAFDEAWKGGEEPTEVEKHWGLYTADRRPKPAMAPAPAGGTDG